MKNASLCLMADGVMKYVYHEDFGTLDAQDFESDTILAIADFTTTVQWAVYFPRLFWGLYKVISVLPAWVLERWFKVLIKPREQLQVSFPFMYHSMAERSNCETRKLLFFTTRKQ